MEINKKYEESYKMWLLRFKSRGMEIKDTPLGDAIVESYNDYVRAQRGAMGCMFFSDEDFAKIDNILKKYRYFVGKIFDWE